MPLNLQVPSGSSLLNIKNGIHTQCRSRKSIESGTFVSYDSTINSIKGGTFYTNIYNSSSEDCTVGIVDINKTVFMLYSIRDAYDALMAYTFVDRKTYNTLSTGYLNTGCYSSSIYSAIRIANNKISILMSSSSGNVTILNLSVTGTGSNMSLAISSSFTTKISTTYATTGYMFPYKNNAIICIITNNTETSIFIADTAGKHCYGRATTNFAIKALNNVFCIDDSTIVISDVENETVWVHVLNISSQTYDVTEKYSTDLYYKPQSTDSNYDVQFLHMFKNICVVSYVRYSNGYYTLECDVVRIDETNAIKNNSSRYSSVRSSTHPYANKYNDNIFVIVYEEKERYQTSYHINKDIWSIKKANNYRTGYDISNESTRQSTSYDTEYTGGTYSCIHNYRLMTLNPKHFTEISFNHNNHEIYGYIDMDLTFYVKKTTGNSDDIIGLTTSNINSNTGTAYMIGTEGFTL